MHRSLPHGSCFPDVRALVRDVRALGFGNASVVVCARDAGAALRSKVRAHQRSARVAAAEHALAAAELGALVAVPAAPTLVWSYEAYVALGDAYVAPLLSFLRLPAVSPRNPGVLGLWRPLSRSDSSRFGSFLNR